MVPKEAIFGKLAALEAYIIAAIVLVVALGAFGLGWLSANQGSQAVLRVIYPDGVPATPVANTAAVAAARAPSSAKTTEGLGNFVASKNGTKYYLTTCSSSNRIKQENKVYFGSKQDAEAAGYGPAANCPGL